MDFHLVLGSVALHRVVAVTAATPAHLCKYLWSVAIRAGTTTLRSKGLCLFFICFLAFLHEGHAGVEIVAVMTKKSG
jgi:hypothetical protein